MDPRRFLTFACMALTLGGCSTLQAITHARVAPVAARPTAAGAAAVRAAVPAVARAPVLKISMAPIPNPPEGGRSLPDVTRRLTRHRAQRSARRWAEAAPTQAHPRTSGQAAIAEANRIAREPSTVGGFVGGVQVFVYDPGRVYEVWTAPLRVTTLTLKPGETIVSKAAGDTVRWQIGETSSGEGANQRTHVMIKPLERGLETNLVLATSQRIYLIELKSGPPRAFNAAVSWDLGAVAPPVPAAPVAAASPAALPPMVTPAGPLDARYRIEAGKGRPAWAPTTVMTDGVHTFLSFPAGLGAQEAPPLFAVSPTGEVQLVNYRQQGGLWVVDRVLERAELRLGDRHPHVVRITRMSGGL